MKKIVMALTVFLLLFLSNITVSYAGDVPEALLHFDGAALYFGRVVERTDASITILPISKIKGDIELNVEITYTKGHMVKSDGARVGRTYLIGSVDENNLYYWITEGMDPKTLKIKNATGLNLRLQNYLNDGEFEKAEKARIEKIKDVAASPAASPTVAPTPATSPSVAPTPAASPTVAPTPAPSPAPGDSSLPVVAGASAQPPSGVQPFIIIGAVALGIITISVLLIVMRKRRKG